MPSLELETPVYKRRGAVTPEIILRICHMFAGPNAYLSDLRLVAFCMTAFSSPPIVEIILSKQVPKVKSLSSDC